MQVSKGIGLHLYVKKPIIHGIGNFEPSSRLDFQSIFLFARKNLRNDGDRI